MSVLYIRDENGKPTEFEVVDMPNLSATVSEETLILGAENSVTEE